VAAAVIALAALAPMAAQAEPEWSGRHRLRSAPVAVVAAAASAARCPAREALAVMAVCMAAAVVAAAQLMSARREAEARARTA